MKKGMPAVGYPFCFRTIGKAAARKLAEALKTDYRLFL
jgi:hypothetical protein